MRRTSSPALTLLVLLAAGASGARGQALFADGFEGGDTWRWKAHTVFVIVMANKDWDEIAGSSSAPYLNGLLSQASHALNYHSTASPAEPNYLWMEGGQAFGVSTDFDPSANHQSSTQHLVSLLVAAQVSWKSYQEDIPGTNCPLTSFSKYKAGHNPMVFFDDVTDANSSTSANCISHVRPYSELSGDLAGGGGLARYDFITPNLCHDMHDFISCASSDEVANGDAWLATAVPSILASAAYQSGGILFIVWDQGDSVACPAGTCPIGLIVLSPEAKGNGYSNSVLYDHSSLLRSIEELLRVGPLLGGAATATDLADLFRSQL